LERWKISAVVLHSVKVPVFIEIMTLTCSKLLMAAVLLEIPFIITILKLKSLEPAFLRFINWRTQEQMRN